MKKLKALLIALMILPVGLLATACSNTPVTDTVNELKGIYNLDGHYIVSSLEINDLLITAQDLENLETLQQKLDLLMADYIAEMSAEHMARFFRIQISIAGDLLLFVPDVDDIASGFGVLRNTELYRFTVSDAIGTKFFDYGVIQMIEKFDDFLAGPNNSENIGFLETVYLRYEDGKLVVKDLMNVGFACIIKINFEKQ